MTAAIMLYHRRMTTSSIFTADAELAASITAALEDCDVPGRVLVNADLHPSPDTVVARIEQFAQSKPAGVDAMVVTLFHHVPPGVDRWREHAAHAALWAFSRQAALAWAAAGIRVNAIGLGTIPDGDPGTQQASVPAFPLPAGQLAGPVSKEDITRTIVAMQRMTSMTGQLIRLSS